MLYDRVRRDIVKEKVEERGGFFILMFSEYIKREENEEEKLELEEIGLSQYHERTRQLTMPLTICTIDQLFDFVYRYKGFEPKLATLAYSKIIIDEVQMYSPDLIAYLVSGLSHITKLGGKFAILTATFPPFVGELLRKEGIRFNMTEPWQIRIEENKTQYKDNKRYDKCRLIIENIERIKYWSFVIQ